MDEATSFESRLGKASRIYRTFRQDQSNEIYYSFLSDHATESWFTRLIAMLVPEQVGGRPSTQGNQYQHIQVGEGATAQLGIIFHISQFLADTDIESYHKLTPGREDQLSLLHFAANVAINSYECPMDEPSDS